MFKLFQIISSVHAQAINQIPASSTPHALNDRMMQIVNWGLWVGGGVAVIYLIYGGFQYITAGSEKPQADQAKQTITYAIIGVVVISFAIIIVRWTTSAITTIGTGGRPNF